MEPADLLLVGDWVLTMDAQRRMIRDGAVAVRDDRIVDVGTRRDLAARWEAGHTLGGSGRILLPGLINAHQHLTGDRLVRSTIPDSLRSDEATFGWAVPVHAAHRPDDDELSATLSLVEAVGNGITFTIEAGTVAHPAAVLAAYDRVGVGGTLGTWGWDVAAADGQPTAPWSGPCAEVLARQEAVLDLTADHPRVDGWVTLV
nr:amidohydrolase family protein [Acidimicrobiia bacterium]